MIIKQIHGEQVKSKINKNLQLIVKSLEIEYQGWQQRFNEKISFPTNKIRKLGTFTNQWYKNQILEV